MTDKSEGAKLGAWSTGRRLVAISLRFFRNVVVGVLAFFLLWAFQSRSLPELERWHAPLEGEFTQKNLKRDFQFENYLQLESQLFDTLHSEVVRAPASEEQGWTPNRFIVGSPSDPTQLRMQNWNRTQILEPEGRLSSGVLLIHGLTDSPYSMRALAEIFQAEGSLAVCLRVPGHGTVPGALTNAKWEDWLAAVRLALNHLKREIPDGAPIHLVGYSNGGALALKHTFDVVRNEEGVQPATLFLINPAVGVSKLAVLSDSHKPFSWMPWFEKFKWMDVLPEYDPFKYNSFPKNAGEQSYELSQRLFKDLKKLKREGRMKNLPPIVTYQSALDATVSINALVRVLYESLENPSSELFFYDLNRFSPMETFLNSDGADIVTELTRRGNLPYKFTVVTNRSSQTREVVLKSKTAKTQFAQTHELNMSWPEAVFSLSHVAVAFRPDDPLYGLEVSGRENTLRLGATAPLGEKGGVSLSLENLMRLRANPFFDVMGDSIRERIKSN